MSTATTLLLSSENSEATEKIGEALGRALKGNELIELVSDLGGGKTTLVRGIARGFGSTDKVASPTFTVNKEYVAGQGADQKQIVHYDFYRLHDPGLLEFELAESLQDPTTVTIIEWADIVHDVLPAERLTIRLTSTGDTARQLQLTADPSVAYLLEPLIKLAT